MRKQHAGRPLRVIDWFSNTYLLAKADESTTSFMIQTLALLKWQRIDLHPVFATEYPDKWCLRDRMHEIACPTLALVGENEGKELIDQAREFYETISSEKKRLHISFLAHGLHFENQNRLRDMANSSFSIERVRDVKKEF